MKTKTPDAEFQRPVKLSCRNLWKVFGPNAAKFMAERDGKATTAELDEAGLVGAVRNTTLDVREGEIFIVMGLSGSGKSTLVRCLSRLIEPTTGELTFDGKDLLKASEAELIEIRRHKMGMVFQHFALLPHLTVLENVAFPLSIQGIGTRCLVNLGPPGSMSPRTVPTRSENCCRTSGRSKAGQSFAINRMSQLTMTIT